MDAGSVVDGRYEVRRPLGVTGGMGDVYLCLDRKLNRQVAVKLIKPEHSSRPEYGERFQREVDSAIALEGHDVVRIHDYGECAQPAGVQPDAALSGTASDQPTAPTPSEQKDAPAIPGSERREEPVSQVRSLVVVVEQLPASAYLEPRTRGLRGGSLWLTMHGYQFPYVPAVAGESGLRIGLSGSAWVDTSYRKVDSGLATQTGDANLHDWRQQARDASWGVSLLLTAHAAAGSCRRKANSNSVSTQLSR